MVSRRHFLAAASALPLSVPAVTAGTRGARAATGDLTTLTSLTTGAKPIAAEERQARIAKLQNLMARRGIVAFLVESGSSLEYFTGIRWHRSERTTAALIPAQGPVIVVTPAFEEPSVRETLQVGGDVRAWQEHESPFQRLAQALKDITAAPGGGATKGTVAVEPTTRFFIIDGIRQVTKDYDLVSGDDLVRACRMHKSPAELALMQVANAVTLAALRYAHAHVRPGMRAADIAALVDTATAALGGRPEFSLVLLNEASAYPHGSLQPEVVRDGSTVLLDCGCAVHGYQSDISRTWVFGTPSARQRAVWNTVKRGQEIALETAKPGIPVGDIDKAVRRYYEGEGWGPGYRLPGLSHRTGHGIGLDGHESPYLVLSDATPLEPGMCFSDEPGIYIPGEFGIRLEDCWHMTETGPALFTPLATSIDQPV
ncbi:Xaa-Pro peptidase family protein [Nitrospirillum sp. BR 11828]|uniref:M24 family metallopeptidase n=1 Tax=Nitrospirillum sp. BR 11828 TaxID=3104325 RepID=UPI002ACA6BBF|nr:Xaa-Pro peptidase family protein [Nitrospirillum sp. BR 11828]MDZ5647172.1 Xaa-Pro peptidase family protein [Nitrospirillum sp. BR 11828]